MGGGTPPWELDAMGMPRWRPEWLGVVEWTPGEIEGGVQNRGKLWNGRH